jgi:UDP-glucose 4-epimerase
MKVLVTGGAGFIGSHIVDLLLANGHQPAVLDNLASGSRENIPEGVPFYKVDICNRAAVAAAFNDFGPDAVSHQAAQMSVSRSVREPVFDAENNVMGLLHVFESAAAVGVKRIVFASSGGVLYGDVTTPATEDHPAAPISPYGISKWVGEKYLEFFVNQHNLGGVALRYGNVYGPRQNPHGEAGVVAIFCEKMLAGLAPTINGDGKYVRDYVYVADVAKANLLALASPLPTPFCPFNIGTALPADTNILAEQLSAAMTAELGQASPQPTHGPARAGDLRSSLVSWDSAARHLGWKPQYSLTEGLTTTAKWFATRNRTH